MDQDLKSSILSVVNDSTGIKATELVLIVQKITYVLYETDVLLKTLDQLVDSGEIIELEYELPAMNYRTKSIYFPKETRFRVEEK